MERIAQTILFIRDQKVMLDADLANLYGVDTKVFVQAVKRNMDRFPEDFMFQLTKQEYDNLRSQIVTSSWGGRRYPPYAFTEQGVAMLSSVLRSKRAIQVNVEIMRAFVGVAADAGESRRPRSQALRPGEEIRRAIQGCIRRHPRTHGSTGTEEKGRNRIFTVERQA